MNRTDTFEQFPIYIPMISILVSIFCYTIGAYIIASFDIIFSIMYVFYCIRIEILVITRSCRDCWYYGRLCGLGKGIIAPLLVKKGDTARFAQRDITLIHLIPDFLVAIIPLVAGIVLLILDFSLITLVLMILLAILFFGGTAFIRGTFSCRYCKQKTIGCPAAEMFNSEIGASPYNPFRFASSARPHKSGHAASSLQRIS